MVFFSWRTMTGKCVPMAAVSRPKWKLPGLQPGNDKEAAFVTTLPPGQYTAQLRGKPETTGTGVVEVYFIP